MTDFHFVYSQRGHKTLIYLGYKYGIAKVSHKDKDKIRWRCNVRKCHASAYLDDAETKILGHIGVHNHQAYSTKDLVRTSICNSLRLDREIGKKTTSQILKEELPQKSGLHLLTKRDINNIRRNVCRRQQQLHVSQTFEESAERDNGLPEGQQNENFKNSEELLTSQQVESTMDFEPQTAFAPVGSIKEEALEITDDSNSLNTYSEELNVNNLNLMPETYLENTPVSHHFIKCEPEFPPECQVHEKTQTDTHTDPQEDYYIGPSEENLTSKIGKEKLIGTNNDFTNLKNVVRKLENISDRLAFAAIADQYEQFGKYLATLLRGIPQKKLLSLKQKLIFDVIQAKMALDESERPSPATDNCSVSQDEYGNVVNLNAFQRNASGTFYRNDNDLPKQENIPTRNSVTSKVTPVVPTSLPLTTFDSNFLRENEENKSHGCSSNSTKSHRKRQAKSIPPNKCLKKPLTEHVQDQLKHTSIIDETVLEDMEEAQFGCLEDSCSIEIQEAVGASETCTEGPSGCSVSPDVCSDNQLTPRALSCESCNLDFSSSIDMKRHFMITHPGEIPSFKKMFSAENPVESSKTYFQELTDTSPATFGGQVEPHFETKKIMKGANVECLQKELRAFLSQTADNQQAVQQQPAQATGRARCLVCPRSKDIKTKFKCEQCYLPMCKRHMKSICNQCLVGIIK